MLHIHNGESSALTARQAGIPGEHVGFRDALVDGPTLVDVSPEQWRRLRADHLSHAYNLDNRQCEENLESQEQVLLTFSNHDEVVLWFEHDLFCQINLLYLLDWFSHRNLVGSKLSLICVDSFPGIADFRGLGQLNADQLLVLFPDRREVTEDTLREGTGAWRSFCAPTPLPLVDCLKYGFDSLPFLGNALGLHLARFPSEINGIGRIGNRIMRIMGSGLSTFSAVFSEFGRQDAGYGFGDFQVWNEIKRMAYTDRPLMEVDGFNVRDEPLESSALAHARLVLTDFGRNVLSGSEDFLAHNRIDYWLGGVHLHNDNVWRWSDSKQEFST